MSRSGNVVCASSHPNRRILNPSGDLSRMCLFSRSVAVVVAVVVVVAAVVAAVTVAVTVGVVA